jgi:hypothetical protein
MDRLSAEKRQYRDQETVTRQVRRKPMSEIALDGLRWHWGGAYEITFTGSAYVAKPRDNGAELTADCAEDLHDLIVTDYSAMAVPREASPRHGIEHAHGRVSHHPVHPEWIRP